MTHYGSGRALSACRRVAPAENIQNTPTSPLQTPSLSPNETILLPKLRIQFADFPLNLFTTWPQTSNLSNLLRFIVRRFHQTRVSPSPGRIFKEIHEKRELGQNEGPNYSMVKRKSLNDSIHFSPSWKNEPLLTHPQSLHFKKKRNLFSLLIYLSSSSGFQLMSPYSFIQINESSIESERNINLFPFRGLDH